MDKLLTANDRAEALSRAYVSAIAAMAGYSTSEPNFDRDSVDLIISAGGHLRPSVAVQLKASTNVQEKDGLIKFPLKIKNYEDLRQPTQTPRILVVLALPDAEDNWLFVSVEQLIIRRAAFWMSLRGMPNSDNENSVTVPIPSSNTFDVPQLKRLMDNARSGTVT